MINAVAARHIHPIRADLGRVDARPGVDQGAVKHLVGFLGIAQIKITQHDHALLARRPGQHSLGNIQHRRVGAIRVDVIDGDALAVDDHLGLGHAGFIVIGIHEHRAGVLQRVAGEDGRAEGAGDRGGAVIGVITQMLGKVAHIIVVVE